MVGFAQSMYKLLMMGVADYLYVLNYGKLLAEGTTSEIQTNPEVIKAYLGGDE